MAIESDIYDYITPDSATFGDFHDFKLLKTTKYAHVYMALRDGKRFLIKTTKDNSPWQCRLLRREYELSISVDHQHIVRIYALEEFESYGIGIVMEYIDGRTLGEYLAEKPPRKELLRIFDELLSAVEYLHCRSIIHNDLKPENILITRVSNTLKLIDFGLADSDAEYAMRELGCTPEYASTELRCQHAEIDTRSDIYSLGVIMCELFGSSPITRRCTAEHAACRYANIAYLRRAWHRYRARWWVVAAIIFVAAVATSICLSIDNNTQQVPAEHVVSSQQKVEPADELSGVETLLQQLESELTREYSITAERVAKEVYEEFAYRHVGLLWERTEAVCRSIESDADSYTDRALLRAHYDSFMLHHYQMLMERASTLPSVSMDLEGEEREFYHQLLNEDMPYRPYRAK